MKLGINTSVWEVAGIPLSQSLDKIKEFGFKHVDLLTFESGDPAKLDQRKKRLIREKFRDLGLASSQMVMVHQGNISSPRSSEREEYLSYLKKCAEFQAELGGKQVLLCHGAGSVTLDISREEAWVNSLRFIQEYCEWLSGLNLFLAMELDPFVYHVVNDTNSMVKMIEEVDASNFFANIDFGHLNITREPPKMLNKLKERIIHAHISDNDGTEHTNQIIGSGTTPVAVYVRKLNELDMEGTCQKYSEEAVVSIEMGEIGEKAEDPDSWVRRSLDYLSAQVPELVR